MSGKGNKTNNRDWREALAQLRPELPPVQAPIPFDFASEPEWDRALRFAHDVLRAAPGSQFPPGSPQYARAALAFALQWATANAVPGLTPTCNGLIRLGGQAARKPGTERAVCLGAIYLLKLGDRTAVEEFVCQDFGSIHAATTFVINLDEEVIDRLREPLLDKLKRDVTPAVAARIAERLARAHADACASTLMSLDEKRRRIVWRMMSKTAQRALDAVCSALGEPARKERADIGARASTLALEEVRALRTHGLELAMLYWVRKHGNDELRRIAAQKIRDYRERSSQPAPARAPRRVDTRLPLHRLVSSWRPEDRRFVLEQAAAAPKSIPLFSTLILDSDARIATRAFERLSQVAPALARQRAAERPKLVSTRSLRWLAKEATTEEMTRILDALSSSGQALSADVTLGLLGAGVDPHQLASHLAREGNGSGLGVLAAFHVHRGDAAALTHVANLAASSVAAEDRHDLIRTALSHSFRAWRYANNVGAGLSSLISALADTDYRAAYTLSLNVLGELNTAITFPRVRRLADAMDDAATLCASRMRGLAVEMQLDGYIIERGDAFVARFETWLSENLSATADNGSVHITAKESGRCTLLMEPPHVSLDVHGYLPWPDPPLRLADLTAALGQPQPDRLREYVPLMRQVTTVTHGLTPVELGWSLVLASTHDADYFEKELSNLAFWVHSLKNSLRAFANANRPSAATTSALERYRTEAQRLLGVFGFHDAPVDEEIDVKVLVDDVLAGYRHTAVLRRVMLTNAIAPDTHVRGPARQVERILSNFVANAIDAVPLDGTVVVTANVDTSRYELTLAVIDDGPGIPSVPLDESFGASRAGTNDGVHFGMGLFEARQLALEVNGAIAIERREEGGTIARVTIPVEVADES